MRLFSWAFLGVNAQQQVIVDAGTVLAFSEDDAKAKCVSIADLRYPPEVFNLVRQGKVLEVSQEHMDVMYEQHDREANNGTSTQLQGLDSEGPPPLDINSHRKGREE